MLSLDQIAPLLRRKVELTESRSLSVSDIGCHLFYQGSNPITITIPSNTFSIGDEQRFPEIEIVQLGTGIITITPSGGVTINGGNSSIELSQNSAIALIFYSSTAIGAFGGELNDRLSAIANQPNPTSAKFFQLNTDGTVSFVNAPSSGGSAISWSLESGNVSMTPNSGYICQGNSLQTLTIPASANAGDLIYVSGQGSGLFRIAQNAGQQIRFGDQVTSTGAPGRIDSFSQGDSLTLLCVSSALWQVISPNGNFEVA